MAGGTSLSIILEGILLILGLLGAAIYIGFHPELLPSFRAFVNQLSNTGTGGVQNVLELAGPWLSNPLVFMLALLFFSGFTPVIEETAKSLATWAVFDRLDSPAQGFVVGALSGAGFGLLESLLASASPDPSWASTLLVRGGSTMMHIMAASLTGWGIASFRASRRVERVLGAYAAAMFLHSLWNASVVLIAFGSVRLATNVSATDILGTAMTFSGATILIALCIVIPLILGLVNRRLRSTPSLPSPKFPPREFGER